VGCRPTYGGVVAYARVGVGTVIVVGACDRVDVIGAEFAVWSSAAGFPRSFFGE
jgi:hypothetical protein